MQFRTVDNCQSTGNLQGGVSVKKKGLWLGLLLTLLLLWPTSVVLADDVDLCYDDGQIFVDEDVSLEPGETFDGDLGVFDGDLTVPQGSVVTGDVFVTNGDVDIAGRVEGDLAVISGDLNLTDSGRIEGDAFVMSGEQEIAGRVGGDLAVMFGHIELRSTAVVEGDIVVLSGSLERESGAKVLGEEMAEIPLPRFFDLPEEPMRPEKPEMPEMPRMPEMPEMPEMPVRPEVPPIPPMVERARQPTFGQQVGRFVGRVMTAGFLSLLFIAVGVLIVFIWPKYTRRVSDCIAAMSVQSFALGLLTFLMALVLEALAVVLMIIIIMVAAALISTIILIPIGLLLILLSVLVLLPVPVLLAAAMVFGWVSLAELVGQKVIRLLNAGYVRPLGATVVGLLVTVPLAATLWIVKPLCCAWPFIILFTSVGLGAVFHTRFGREACQQAKPPAEVEALPADAMDEESGQPDGPANGTP
jgi:cytoskeletal protein CcmA (bactofilin family)